MVEEKTSTLSNGWLWLGASISISGILTGTIIAPLGMTKGIISILLGHIIGGAIMYLAGMIGANTELNSMETVQISFGRKGGLSFSVLNVLQLIGWTAVMIRNTANAVNVLLGLGGNTAAIVTSIIIGVFIFIWMLMDIKHLEKANNLTVIALSVLCIVLTYKIIQGSAIVSNISNPSAITFGGAVELSVVMPLSWAPLIADYLRDAKHPKNANLVSNLFYFLGNSWMFIIGLGATHLTGITDVAELMRFMGLGIIGVLIIILGTLTTAYLDVKSAAISFCTITDRYSEKKVGLATAIIGTIIGSLLPISQFGNFLYLIGSFFTPMIAILIADYFLLKRQTTTVYFDKINLLLWFIGFVIYRLLLNVSTPLGTSLPVIIIIMILCYVINGRRYKLDNIDNC